MKIELTDPDKRIFMLYRMCYIGGLDPDWLFLDEGKLPALLKKYVATSVGNRFLSLCEKPFRVCPRNGPQRFDIQKRIRKKP